MLRISDRALAAPCRDDVRLKRNGHTDAGNSAGVRYILAMVGRANIKPTQGGAWLSIRARKNIHSAKHPARFTRATLKPEGGLPPTVADLLSAPNAEAQAEGEMEEGMNLRAWLKWHHA